MEQPIAKVLNETSVRFSAAMLHIADVYIHAEMASRIFAQLQDDFAPFLLHEDLKGLLQDLNISYEAVITGLKRTTSKGQRDLLQAIAAQAVECALFLRERCGASSFRLRTKSDSEWLPDEQFSGLIHEYTTTIQHLRDMFVAEKYQWPDTHVITSVGDIAENVLLTRLDYVRNAGFNSTKSCLPNTREFTIGEAFDWILDPTAARMLLIIGSAGTGKSAIAHSIGKHAHQLGRLGSFFDLNVMRPQNGSDLTNILEPPVHGPEHVIQTLARNLASWNSHFYSALASALNNNDFSPSSNDITAQWNQLIVQPANSVKFIGPVAIIFDNFDTLANSAASVALKCFIDDTVRLPPNFRIIVVTRPTRAVLSLLRDPTQTQVYNCIDVDQSVDTKQSIRNYIQQELSEDGRLELEDTQLTDLVDASDDWFLWAAYTCRALKVSEPGSTLFERFQLNSYAQHRDKSLDSYYLQILETQSRCLESPTPFDPMSRSSMERHVEIFNRLDIIGALIPGSYQPGAPIRPIHSSFLDFLTNETNETRRRAWYISLDRSESSTRPDFKTREQPWLAEMLETLFPPATLPLLGQSSSSLHILPAYPNDAERAFRRLDTQHTGRLGSRELVPYFLRSRLSLSVLADIWDLADSDQDGTLELQEFAKMFDLVRARVPTFDMDLSGANFPTASAPHAAASSREYIANRPAPFDEAPVLPSAFTPLRSYHSIPHELSAPDSGSSLVSFADFTMEDTSFHV